MLSIYISTPPTTTVTPLFPSEDLFIGREDEKIFSSSSAPKRKYISLGEEVVEWAEGLSFFYSAILHLLLLLLYSSPNKQKSWEERR